MKICMVFSLPFPPKEGIGNYVYFLSKRLLEKGHNVVIITRGSWRKTAKEIIDDIEVIKAPFLPIYPFYLQLHGMYVKKIFQLLEPEIDLVHFHSPLPPFIRTERPIVTTIHTPMLTDYRIEKFTSIHSMLSKMSARFVSYPLEKKLIHSSKIIMTLTNTIVQELSQEYHLDTNKIVVVGNGVDTDFFFPGKQESDDDQRYILFAGWIEYRKGIFDLLECAREICATESDVIFLLAGQGSQFNKLKQKIITSGASRQIYFIRSS
jgi:glycosyltransferase involved in cell wall biosynthesis